jgi:hypothetical protein
MRRNCRPANVSDISTDATDARQAQAGGGEHLNLIKRIAFENTVLQMTPNENMD